MRSPAATWCKIGLSERAPYFRARELTADAVYGAIGPWEVVDYRQVRDVFASEKLLHRHFAAKAVPHGPARELFDVPVDAARAKLLEVAGADLDRGDLVGRMRLEPDLMRYMQRLFCETGLVQFIDLQEMWTLSLFPATAGGRLFTLNIDRHEVAYAAPIRGANAHEFMLYADQLIAEIDAVGDWLETRNGGMEQGNNGSALEAGVSLHWEGSLEDALSVFDLPMMRRALVACWYDSLLGLRDRSKRSFFARFHNHNAVQELLRSDFNKKETKT